MKKFPKFVRLIDRQQTLYLHCSATRSECFVPEDVSASSTFDTSWRWEISFIGRYSHISLNVFEKCLDQISTTYNKKSYKRNEEIEDYNWRPEFPTTIVKTSEMTDRSNKLSYISHRGITHIALILIFPTTSVIEEWDVCIIHHPCQDEETAQNHVLEFIAQSPSPEKYNPISIKGRNVEQCESGFFMLLYAYLAFQAKNLNHFSNLMKTVIREPELKPKCQQWIQAIMRTKAAVSLPWLSQILWDPTTHVPTHNSHSTNSLNDTESDQSESSQENAIEENPNIPRNVMDDNPNTSKRNRQSFQEEERRTRNRTIQTFHGLKNPKNLCYMNVVIQLMYGLRCVKDHISKIQNQQNQFLSLALKKLFHQLSSNKEASSAITFKKELTTLPYFQEFDNDHQHDSHQLLTKIIEILFQEFTSYHQSNVPFWFRSTLISKIECNTCHFISSNTGDHSTSIEIEIHGNNLEECLSNFFRKEAIDHWHCRKCLMKRTAHKYFLLQERPILILTLKRFNNNLQKINTNVNFPPDNLTIPNLVTNEFTSTNKTRYNLFAVINHFSMNASSGHYNLYMKVNDGWNIFDDELVVPMNEREINSSNAYTLVYIIESKLKDLGC